MKKENKIQKMQKKFGKIFESLQVDPITGQYYLTMPESIINELSWYEDTEICFKIEGDEIVLSERSN